MAGDTQGYMMAFDMRTQHDYGAFKGTGGAIRDMAFHPTLPLIASCSLDRSAAPIARPTANSAAQTRARPRRHVPQARTQGLCMGRQSATHCRQLYAKQKLNCVLFSKELPIKIKVCVC